MALKFPVKPRTILLCDYSLGGFRAPEMVKRRPAVVIAGRLPRRDNLHTVVPLSGTPSDPRNLYQCEIELAAPLPAPFDETRWWVKADMIATVSLARLELFRTSRDQFGQRKYLSGLAVSEEQFALIMSAVRHALGMPVDK
jgi:mRNA interferase MazF